MEESWISFKRDTHFNIHILISTFKGDKLTCKEIYMKRLFYMVHVSSENVYRSINPGPLDIVLVTDRGTAATFWWHWD